MGIHGCNSLCRASDNLHSAQKQYEDRLRGIDDENEILRELHEIALEEMRFWEEIFYHTKDLLAEDL